MKKIAIGIGVLLLLIIAAIGAIDFIVNRFPDPCGGELIAAVVSPSHTLKAVIFEYDCGATTDYSTQVSILSINASSKDTGRSFFVADTDHGSAPFGAGGGPEIRVRWLSDTSLEVRYHLFARIIRAESKVEGIEIVYGTFQ